MAATTNPTPNRLGKMTDLLKKMGATEELTKQFGELLEGYTAEQKTIVESKYAAKLETAKALCLEETNRFKNQLAKRVSLFFEAKAEKIESQMAKQVAIRESAAEADLKNIKALLEGVQVNANGEVDLQAIKTQLGSLQKQVGVLKEERNQAVTKANRANSIAQKALSRNRVLEEAAKSKPNASSTAAPIAESVQPAAPAAAKPIQAPARRTGAQPTAPTTVMSEGVQTGRSPARAPAVQPTGTMAAWDPNNIAANMGE